MRMSQALWAPSQTCAPSILILILAHRLTVLSAARMAPIPPSSPRLALGADWDPATAGAADLVLSDLSLKRQLQAFANESDPWVSLQVGPISGALFPSWACLTP